MDTNFKLDQILRMRRDAQSSKEDFIKQSKIVPFKTDFSPSTSILDQLQLSVPIYGACSSFNCPAWLFLFFLRPCLLMIVSTLLSILASLAVALWLSFTHDISTGFTVGGYMIAVAALPIGFGVYKHQNRCDCFEGPNAAQETP